APQRLAGFIAYVEDEPVVLDRKVQNVGPRYAVGEREAVLLQQIEDRDLPLVLRVGVPACAELTFELDADDAVGTLGRLAGHGLGLRLRRPTRRRGGGCSSESRSSGHAPPGPPLPQGG